MADLHFWFDFASTYSYPAAWMVEERAASAGIKVHWRPFLLGPIFGAQGWRDSPFNIYPAKGAYMWRDMERICAHLNLGLIRPSVFPRNGLMAARVSLAAIDAGIGPAFVRAVYQANFATDSDISDPAILEKILADVTAKEKPDVQTSPPHLISQAASPEIKARLKDNTEQAVALGIIGAPSFSVDHEIFWGQDRLDTAIDWARAGTKAH